MPVPVSATSTRTNPACLRVATVMRPDPAIAWEALMMR